MRKRPISNQLGAAEIAGCHKRLKQLIEKRKELDKQIEDANTELSEWMDRDENARTLLVPRDEVRKWALKPHMWQQCWEDGICSCCNTIHCGIFEFDVQRLCTDCFATKLEIWVNDIYADLPDKKDNTVPLVASPLAILLAANKKT